MDKPVKFKVQTTRGYLPKDYETVQAIVGMWRKVGIEAEIEVYEIAKHFELRLSHKLAPMAFYNWGDAIGDPNDSTGFAMFGPSPHSGWKSKDVDAMIGPLWGEKDEAKRIAGWKKVDKYIAENALVLPLYQQVQTILFKKTVAVKPHLAGYLLAQSVPKQGLISAPKTRRGPEPMPLRRLLWALPPCWACWWWCSCCCAWRRATRSR